MGKRRTDAIVFTAPRQVAVAQFPLPEMGPDEVIVDIEHSFISNGTERWCLTDQMRIPGSPPLAFPHVPGYQAAGTVTEVGSRIVGLKPGERVFSRNCREPGGFKGSWLGGHVKMHVNNLHDIVPLPADVSTIEGSGLLLAQVGFNGATKPRVSEGDVAVVIGEGLVGQFAGQVLRSRGAYVIMAGLSPGRLDLAARYSADEVFDNGEGGLTEFIRDRQPEGVSIVVETASSSRTVHMGAELLGKHGQLVLNGYYPPDESMIDWHWLRRKEITLYCPDSRNRERLDATLSLIQEGRMHVEELITHRVDAVDVPDAYAMLLDPAAQFLGVVIDWRNRQE